MQTLSPTKYTELIAIRNKAKDITQLSYNLSKLEKMYPIDDRMTDDKADELINAYNTLLKTK